MIDQQAVYEWITSGSKKSPKKKTSFKKTEMYLCPKSEICVMDCPHKVPHTFDDFCDPESRVNIEAHRGEPCECPKCVPELAADITFFEEDFEL